jgi:putative ABC transport system permease protein
LSTYDYIPQYQDEAGRGPDYFRGRLASDTTQAMVLNEAAVRMLGYHSPQDALGRDFSQWGRKGKIIGVVKDFHYQSLQHGHPAVVACGSSRKTVSEISVKVGMTDLKKNDRRHRKGLAGDHPLTRPFSYSFVDEMFDQPVPGGGPVWASCSCISAVLAIFISCLGLAGAGLVQHGTADQGDRGTQGAGSKRGWYCGVAVQGFPLAGGDRFRGGDA